MTMSSHHHFRTIKPEVHDHPYVVVAYSYTTEKFACVTCQVSLIRSDSHTLQTHLTPKLLWSLTHLKLIF